MARTLLPTLLAALVALALGYALGGRGRPAPAVDARESAPAAPRPAVRSEPPMRLVAPAAETPRAREPHGEERVAVTDRSLAAAVAEVRGFGPAGDLFLELSRTLPQDAEPERQNLVRLLARLHLAAEDPHAALSALERHGCTSAREFAEVGRLLRAADDPAAAARAHLAALAFDPGDPTSARALTRLDPEGAIATLESALAVGEPLDRRAARSSLAELYAASGRTAEARALVEELLLHDRRDLRLLAALEKIDPGATETRYRALAADREHGGTWNRRLANLLAEQGRAEEAADLLEARLFAVPTDTKLRGTFISAAPARAYAYLDRTLPIGTRDEDAGDLWGHVADELLELGDRERALEAYRRATLTTNDDPRDWSYALFENAPERLVPVLEERVALRPEPVSFGALADAYWRAGQTGDALDGWRRAAALDPEDGEWTEKLAAVAEGLDPLDD